MASYGFTFSAGDTVTPTRLNSARTVSDIVNADIKSDAAIAGTKIAPDFGGQNITTSGSANINRPSDHWASTGVFVVGGGTRLGQLDTHGSFELSLTSNGYRDNTAGTNLWKSYEANTLLGASQIGLNPDGSIRFRAETTKATGSSLGVSERMRLTGDGTLSVGTTNPNAAAIIDVSSTTRGFLPPRMTTTQRNAITTPPAGLMVYNTTTNKLNFYNGTAWEAVTSA